MLVIGAVLIVVAAVLAVPAVIALLRYTAHRDFERLRPRALVARDGQDIEVTGVAVAGPYGEDESRLARIACVWHCHEVLRHYWTPAPVPETGERERTYDSIAEYGEEVPFGLVGPGTPEDRAATVLVDPADAAADGIDLALQRVVGRPQKGVRAPADDLLPRVKGRISGLFRGETIEFEYREWLIKSGTPVTVRGRVQVRDGRPFLTAPPDDKLRITRTEQPPAQEAAHSARKALLLGGGTLASVGVGLLMVLGAV
ncbi:hypothetical protein J0910_04780 [Nocardiopsis sp. CNT-189]|uniref:GIDE domain-containing protein n=1 Tax=Nocardiopsis oceanisediminis TaxID=2816862 RepID=UPI003B2C7563